MTSRARASHEVRSRASDAPAHRGDLPSWPCATTQPSASWLAQQLRELTPFGGGPKFLLRDNDRKFGAAFDEVARGAGTTVIRTPILAPKANGHIERLIGTLRRECLDHMILLSEPHPQPVLDEYRHFYNEHGLAKALSSDGLRTPPCPHGRRSAPPAPPSRPALCSVASTTTTAWRLDRCA